MIIKKMIPREYDSDYQLSYYHSKRRRAEELLGGVCSRCKGSDRLRIVYKQPEKHSINTSSFIRRKDFPDRLNEVMLLCMSCKSTVIWQRHKDVI